VQKKAQAAPRGLTGIQQRTCGEQGRGLEDVCCLKVQHGAADHIQKLPAPALAAARASSPVEGFSMNIRRYAPYLIIGILSLDLGCHPQGPRFFSASKNREKAYKEFCQLIPCFSSPQKNKNSKL